MSKKLIDITNQKFGRLIALERVEIIKSRGSIWKCLCDCGNEKDVSIGNLRSGHTKSCGCIRTDQLIKAGKSHRKKKGESNFNSVFQSYRVNAEKRSLDFLLTKEDVKKITQQQCHYCRRPPSQIYNVKGRYGAYIYNGIDRINNKKGYTLDNSVPCCKDCNIAKGTKSLEEFVKWIAQVYVHTVKDNYP